MNDALAALAFLLLVLGALSVSRARDPQIERARVRRFIGIAVGLSMAVGLGQLDLYPFCSWPLVAGLVPDTITAPRLVGVDAAGVDIALDARALRPIPPDELWSWLSGRFVTLPSPVQDSIAEWIVLHAETARARAAGGRGIGEFGLLGPVGAPFFLLHPRPWDEPGLVPSTPIVGVRLYRERWPLGSKRAGKAPRRDLLYAWPRTGRP